MKKVLGRGLDILIPKILEGKDKLIEISIEDVVVVHKLREIDEKTQQELAQSIKEKGIIQPIVVREQMGKYELVAGYRRLEAVKLAGLNKIPAIVKDIPKEEEMELAVIENIQRKDLNPIEEAEAYHKILETKDYTHEELAKIIGKDRSYVSNILRLLKLPEKVKEYLKRGELSFGHAKALAGIEDQSYIEELAARAVRERLSVREVERLAKAKEVSRETIMDEFFKNQERMLQEKLGTKVEIRGKEKGKILIYYYSREDLERLIAML